MGGRGGREVRVSRKEHKRAWREQGREQAMGRRARAEACESGDVGGGGVGGGGMGRVSGGGA